MATKKQQHVGMTDEEWDALKKRRLKELAATCGPIKVRQSGTMRDYFSSTRPKNGRVYQFSAK
ncbi:MAG: hypothetical protein FWG79_08905 [Bacteroidales bacterium]|nr:hypothetical protein [Bacteroidales bacterium]